MPNTSFPTYSDLQAYAPEIGVALPSQNFCQLLINATINETNDLVGFQFLNTDDTIATLTYEFPSASGILHLPPIQSITSVELEGQAIEYEQVDDRTIKFTTRCFGLLSITGIFGYEEIPDEVFYLFQNYVCYKIIFGNPQRTYRRLDQADVKIEMVEPIDVPGQYKEAMERYRWAN